MLRVGLKELVCLSPYECTGQHGLQIQVSGAISEPIFGSLTAILALISQIVPLVRQVGGGRGEW